MEGLRIHKKKVPVRIQLADRKTLSGQLYSNLLRPDGSPASVADRLNDPTEKFLPLAVENKHYLLSKSRMVSVRLRAGEIEAPMAEGVKTLAVQAILSTGESVVGKLYAFLPPAQARALDYLNGATQNFLPLWCENQVTLINVDYLLGVTESGNNTLASNSSNVWS